MSIKRMVQIILGLAVLFFIGSGIYDQANKKPRSAKAKRLPCQKKSITFERTYIKPAIQKIQESLKNGAYTINIRKEEAVYMETRLFEYVDTDNVKTMIEKEFLTYAKESKNSNENVTIDLLIYENDRGNPGKKTKKSKLYAGYLMFSFKLGGKEVYKIQIDFMNHEGKDIKQKIACAAKSIMTL